MADLDVDPADLPPGRGYRLLTGLVTPRPIAWVSTLAADGTRNLAPHSYHNVISGEPPIVHFTSVGVKDTLRNVRATGEFVVNVVSADLIDVMNLTSGDFPPEEDEFSWARLEAAPSVVVAPPRVAVAPAAMECRLDEIISKGDGHMVFGEVVRFHIAERVLTAGGLVDSHKLGPIGRLGGAEYLTADGIVARGRPRWQDLREPG